MSHVLLRFYVRNYALNTPDLPFQARRVVISVAPGADFHCLMSSRDTQPIRNAGAQKVCYLKTVKLFELSLMQNSCTQRKHTAFVEAAQRWLLPSRPKSSFLAHRELLPHLRVISFAQLAPLSTSSQSTRLHTKKLLGALNTVPRLQACSQNRLIRLT